MVRGSNTITQKTIDSLNRQFDSLGSQSIQALQQLVNRPIINQSKLFAGLIKRNQIQASKILVQKQGEAVTSAANKVFQDNQKQFQETVVQAEGKIRQAFGEQQEALTSRISQLTSSNNQNNQQGIDIKKLAIPAVILGVIAFG